ncbi:HAMP domain-containing sensor histidine kinase [Thalassotalea sp. SU-HH00458]|uniref:sensor histidine kinase n=1 Tax=Thalassotalea sp. SU-HH00458 TaxID=3127657 RepID=UPI003109216A
MSLRNYLFILIGCLITLLTITQLVVVNWIEKNLASEVDFQARHYSDQIIELAVEKLDAQQSPSVIIKHTIDDEEKVKVINKNIDIFSVDSNELLTEIEVELAKPQKHDSNVDNQSSELDRKILTREFKALVANIHEEKAKILKHNATDNNGTSTSPKTVSHTWITSKSISPSSKVLFEKIQLTLIIIGILGLIFAYWLSTKFNKPLKKLSNGFSLLEKGDYHFQVEDKGVKEIRDTIRHFNLMVVRLSQLSQAEKHHKEIAHLAELGEVSRGLAHALRNPIHTIGLSIEQLSDQSLVQSQKENLIHTIQQKIENIDKSIKALLSLTTTGIKREENVPILGVVQDIILEYKSCTSKKIHFEIDIEQSLNIIGSESEIRSILHTLINNACEASHENATVYINAKLINSLLNVTINDNGMGLDKHIKKQLFQPHVSTKPEGAGMGLYIAKRLISLHYQGTLTLSNIKGKNGRIEGCSAQASFTIPNTIPNENTTISEQ